MSVIKPFHLVFQEGGVTARFDELSDAKTFAAKTAATTEKPAFVLTLEGVAYPKAAPVVYSEINSDGEPEVIIENASEERKRLPYQADADAMLTMLRAAKLNAPPASASGLGSFAGLGR